MHKKKIQVFLAVTDPRKQTHAPLAADHTLATTGPRTALSRETLWEGGDRGGGIMGGGNETVPETMCTRTN